MDFHSRRGTPLNPGNARRRYWKPAALAAGIQMGGCTISGTR